MYIHKLKVSIFNTIYPKLEEHRAHHREFIDKLSYKKGRFAAGDSSEEVDSILEFLSDWFMHHTAEEDRLFANFLKR